MPWEDGWYTPEEHITCVDCGGECSLLTRPPGPDEDPFEPGDRLVYRCRDCLDRWDLLVPDVDGFDAD
jgi:hypothetical protein